MSPILSEAQRRWVHKNHPEMAERWEKETPADSKLPEHVGKKKKKKKTWAEAMKQRKIGR